MRMQRIAAVLFVALTQAGTASVWAQTSYEKPGVSFGLVTGGTVPTGDYSKVANTGYHIGGFVDFGRMTGPIGLRADLTYNGFGDKDLLTSGGGTTSLTFSNKFSMINGNLNLVVGIPMKTSPVRPYLIGGAGAYYVKNSPKCSGTACAPGLFSYPETSNTKFGINGGGGVEFGIGSASAFLEARYHNIFEAVPRLSCLGTQGCAKSAATLVPLTFGIKINY